MSVRNIVKCVTSSEIEPHLKRSRFVALIVLAEAADVPIECRRGPSEVEPNG